MDVCGIKKICLLSEFSRDGSRKGKKITNVTKEEKTGWGKFLEEVWDYLKGT